MDGADGRAGGEGANLGEHDEARRRGQVGRGRGCGWVWDEKGDARAAAAAAAAFLRVLTREVFDRSQ